MGFVQITKDGRTNIESETPKVNISRTNDTDSLNRLNNADKGYNYDFGNSGKNKNKERLKNERTILSACLFTFFRVFIGILVFVGLFFLVTSFLDFEFFYQQSSYTTKEFNEELRNCIILLFSSLLIVCVILKVYINSVVRACFKKKYLSKFNIYIYDVFLVLLNVISYILLAVIYFYIINGIYGDFKSWLDLGIISKEGNIEIINWFKYVVVVMISIFMSVNSFTGFSIVYKKNKFIFEDVK